MLYSGYPTPDAQTGDVTYGCIPIYVPNNSEFASQFAAIIYGLYSAMSNEDFWHEFGTLSPELAAQYAAQGLAQTEAYAECPQMSEGFQIGDVKWIPHDTIPANWLLCDSTVHNRVDYPDLYTLLTEFQIDADTFNVPNMHNRFPLGNEVLANPVGVEAGNANVTLSDANVPPHVHTMAHTHTVPRHNAGSGTMMIASASGGTTVNATTSQPSNPNTGSFGGSGGIQTAFSVMNPNVGGRYIIKAL